MKKHMEILEILQSMQVNEADLIGINTNLHVSLEPKFQAIVYVRDSSHTAVMFRDAYKFDTDVNDKIDRAKITAHHLDGNSYTLHLRII